LPLVRERLLHLATEAFEVFFDARRREHVFAITIFIGITAFSLPASGPGRMPAGAGEDSQRPKCLIDRSGDLFLFFLVGF